VKADGQRIDRTTKNRTDARDRTAKKQAMWAEMDKEESDLRAAEAQARAQARAREAGAATGTMGTGGTS
jgi:hypothetical protein